MNPFNLSGPAFLIFFAGLCGLALAGIAAMRAYAASCDVGPPDPHLDDYELACLAGGRGRVALLAVATLLERGDAALKNGALSYSNRRVDPKTHPVERELLAARPATPARALAAVARSAATIESTLEAERLTVGRDATMLVRFVGASVTVAVLLVGGTKFWVGLGRGKPIEFLFVMTALAVLALVWLAGRPLSQTARARRILRKLEASRPKPKAHAVAPDVAVPSTMVALWGASALSASPAHADLRRGFAGADGGGGSVTSSSSCSSGDGGGGGGGCGGCGGGGD